jgi:4,5-dihydroxyphthalate decarboxylase
MKLSLSIALSSNLRTRPVLEGTVTPEGIDLTPSELHPSEMFWRQLKFAEFDVSEMSLSSLMMAIAKGDERWVGLPVFTTRHFFQTWILVRRDAGIETPADLKGKRVGVPEYQQTAALWSRGILQHEWGVAPRDMEFWMERVPARSHAGAMGFTPPAGVTIHQIPPEKDIGGMMLARELDATLLYLASPNLVDRSSADLWHHPQIRPLFPDANAEGSRYFKKTGIFPMNHAMVVRSEIAKSHPWVVLNLFRCFLRANDLANRARLEHVDYHLATGLLPPAAGEALRTTLAQHGVEPNRNVLETAARYSYEQGLTPRLMRLEEIFAACTLDRS